MSSRAFLEMINNFASQLGIRRAKGNGAINQNPAIPPGSIWIQNEPSTSELCPYCGNRGIGMNGYCVGCGHDRGPRKPQEIVASITDSFILGSRIDIEVTQ